MTPAEQKETLDIFAGVKASRCKTLIDAVIKDDYITARELAKLMIRDDELLGEITIRMQQNPHLTKEDLVTYVKTRTAYLKSKPNPTVWELLLQETV